MTDARKSGGNISVTRAERRWRFSLTALLAAVGGSGFITLFPGYGVAWRDWWVLLHGFGGFALVAALLPYLFLHGRRGFGLRNPTGAVGGVLAALLSLLVAGSGMHIGLFGRIEAMRWVYELHLYVAIALAAGLLLHWLSARRGALSGADVRFRLSWRDGLSALAGIFVALALVMGFDWSYRAAASSTGPVSGVQPYELPYGDHPFVPSQSATPGDRFVAAERLANARRCAGCHQEIAEQWRSSAHALAAADPAYVRNIDLLVATKGMAAARYCEGCHAPVALLSGQLTKGGSHGGEQGTAAFDEGVGCTLCHGIRSLVHEKGVASYRFEDPDVYPFAASRDGLPAMLHDWLVRVDPARHVAAMDAEVLSRSVYCAACHEQFMDHSINEWGWVKMQDEYSVWQASPYAAQGGDEFSEEGRTRCQDCHMPLEAAHDPSADRDGRVRSHHFATANTLLPMLAGDHRQLQRVTEFLRANRLRVSIDFRPPEGVEEGGFAHSQRALDASEAPSYAYLGDEVSFEVTVQNTGVGHAFPAGTTDINEVWLDVTVQDATGREVFRSGGLDEALNVDPQAHFYRTIAVDRHGKEVWKHDLFRMAGDAYKRRIMPGESDVANYRFTVPYWAKGPLNVSAILQYRKLNRRYSNWVFTPVSVEIPVVSMAGASDLLPLEIRRP